MPFCVFSKMAAAAVCNFYKVTFWTLDDTCIAEIRCKRIKNCPRYVVLCIFQDGGRHHLEFPKSDIFNPR